MAAASFTNALVILLQFNTAFCLTPAVPGGLNATRRESEREYFYCLSRESLSAHRAALLSHPLADGPCFHSCGHMPRKQQQFWKGEAVKTRMTGTFTCERLFRGSDDCVALRGCKDKKVKKVFSFPFLSFGCLCHSLFMCVCTLICFAAFVCLLL